jgi:hypothetical protein
VRSLPWKAILLTLSACTTDVTHGVPEKEFGHLTASLGGHSFSGTFGPDSTVAIYDADVGQLQIEGNRRVGGWSEVVRLVMVCESIPDPGAYRVSAPFFTPVSAGVYRTRIRRWLPRRWATAIHFFLSDSMPPGILQLDTLDLKSGAISGTFRVGVRTVNRTPVDTLFVTGAFTGRVRTSTMPRTRPIRFSPQMGRDCKGAKSR